MQHLISSYYFEILTKLLKNCATELKCVLIFNDVKIIT